MSTTPFRIEIADHSAAAGVATIWLTQGDRPVVVLDSGILDRLEATLDALPTDLTGLVVASEAPRAFVAGADLKSIMAMAEPELDAYLARGQQIFGRLGAMPVPTAAALHGATLGGGFELAAHCDGLIAKPAARPYPVGLPEAGLALCPGWGGTQFLPSRIDPAAAITQACTGKTMLFDDAAELGLFDVVADLDDDVAAVAAQWVADRNGSDKPNDGAPLRWIGRQPNAVRSALEAVEPGQSEASDAVLECVRVGLDSGFAAALEAERRNLVRLRSTEAAQRAIQAFFAKSAKT